jgi:hypothetical protein
MIVDFLIKPSETRAHLYRSLKLLWNKPQERADRWAYRSHQQAVAAWDAGKFTQEIVSVPVGKGKTGEAVYFTNDEGPRRETTMENLASGQCTPTGYAQPAIPLPRTRLCRSPRLREKG